MLLPHVSETNGDFIFSSDRHLLTMSLVSEMSAAEKNLCRVAPPIGFEKSFIFVLRKNRSKTKKRTKEEEIEKGGSGGASR